MSFVEFDPIVEVKVNASVYSRKFDISLTRLPINQPLEYYIFEPGDGIAGTGTILSESNGTKNVTFHEISSRPTKKGIYHFGVGTTKYKNTKYQNKGRQPISLGIWKNLAGDKKLISFDVDFEKVTTLSINVEKMVPWGTTVRVSGRLWHKNEKLPWCNGSTSFQGRTIIISGNHIEEVSTKTDAFSSFSAEINVGKELRSDCCVQAHYEGDDEFDKCHSNIVSYEVTKRHTTISLKIEPLVQTLGDSIEPPGPRPALKIGRFYVFSGQLIDKDTSCQIAGKIINLSAPEEMNLSPVVTDSKGNYKSWTKIPNLRTTSSIELQFTEDGEYFSSSVKESFDIIAETPFLINTFKQFNAISLFENGFDRLDENSQIRSCIWLLYLLNANPIPLSILDKKDGEQITKNGNRLNYSADIIADFEEVPLIIDATVSVPSVQKIDKIFNTATYLTTVIGKIFIPLIISNQSANAVKREASRSHVLLFDRDDIVQIVNLIIANDLSGAIELFSYKLRKFMDDLASTIG